MIPAAIILAGAIERLWLRLGPGRPLIWLKYALAASLTVVIADEAMNFYGVYRVNRATYDGIQDVARWFSHNTPTGSCVVSNVIHGEEIKWHSGGHFENYWTVGAGVCDPSRVVDQPEKLQRLRHIGRPTRVFARRGFRLPAVQGRLPPKPLCPPARRSHGTDRTRSPDAGRYPFADPLRCLVRANMFPSWERRTW